MNTAVLGGCYIFLAAAVFVYAVQSYERCIRSFGIGIALNVFPLIWCSYLGNEESTRIARIPISYLPFCASMLASIFVTRLHFLRSDRVLFYAFIGFAACLLMQSLAVVEYHLSFMQYWLMWLLNINTMLCISFMVASITNDRRNVLIFQWVTMMAVCSVVGVAKFLLGLSPDSNFMPMMNRNGTVFLVVVTIPFVFYLLDKSVISRKGAGVAMVAMMACLVLSRSRMGMLGFVFAVVFYFAAVTLNAWKHSLSGRRLRLQSLSMGLVIALCGAGCLLTPVGDVVILKIEQTGETVIRLINGEDSHAAELDNKRIRLSEQSIELIRENFWFGTGVGLANYQKKLIDIGAVELSKPHNFYLSGFAEFGAVGSAILALLLYLVWRQLSGTRYAAESAVRRIAFQSVFMSVLFMLSMNEYITHPLVWVIWGFGTGWESQTPRHMIQSRPTHHLSIHQSAFAKG